MTGVTCGAGDSQTINFYYMILQHGNFPMIQKELTTKAITDLYQGPTSRKYQGKVRENIPYRETSGNLNIALTHQGKSGNLNITLTHQAKPGNLNIVLNIRENQGILQFLKISGKNQGIYFSELIKSQMSLFFNVNILLNITSSIK